MAKLFDIESIDVHEPEQIPEDKSGIMVERFIKLHEERISGTKDLIGRLPLEGEVMFIHTTNSFTAFTFIPFVIKEVGRIEELIVSTYSINIRVIDSLVRYIDKGLILSVSLTISDSIRQNNTKVYDHLMAIVDKKPVKVTLSWNHSKIALMRAGGHYLNVEGSGNWAENSMHEQYVFVNSKRVFEFRKNEILNGINPCTI